MFRRARKIFTKKSFKFTERYNFEITPDPSLYEPPNLFLFKPVARFIPGLTMFVSSEKIITKFIFMCMKVKDNQHLFVDGSDERKSYEAFLGLIEKPPTGYLRDVFICLCQCAGTIYMYLNYLPVQSNMTSFSVQFTFYVFTVLALINNTNNIILLNYIKDKYMILHKLVHFIDHHEKN